MAGPHAWVGPAGSPGSLRAIVLIDGEHYPPVIARAVAALSETYEVTAALLVGGGEKLGQVQMQIGVPVHHGPDPEQALASLLASDPVDVVYDLSDEPVLGYEARCRMASIALWRGAEYRGADFVLTAPPRPDVARVPSIAVIGTGKRTGKTALAGALARAIAGRGGSPVVVAMGRGGPAEPEVIRPDQVLDAATLLGLAEQGRHSASDHFEDALTARVPTVGSWRAGGGLAGGVAFGNYRAAIEAAHDLDPSILILEGSGSAIPPARADACLLAVDSRLEPHLLRGYLGLYRVLLSDVVVLTMCEEPIDREKIAALESCIRSGPSNPPRVLRTVFRPHPLGEVSGKKIWLITTASPQATGLMSRHLEQTHSTKVVAASYALADRKRLAEDLGTFPNADAIVVELKAAAVDVVAKFGLDRGMEVIFLDNRPEPVDGQDLGDAFHELVTIAEGNHR